jgi:uncharacterized protein
VSAIVRIGLISDTHGAVPAGVARALSGVARILHAGDVGSSRVIDDLTRIAPVTAVRGNTDHDPWLALHLPVFSVTDIAGVRVGLTHIRDRALTVEDARRRGCDVYVFGHTHVPDAVEEDGLWLVNPGSPSRARGGHGHGVGIVEVSDGQVLSVGLIALD